MAYLIKKNDYSLYKQLKYNLFLYIINGYIY